MVFVKTRLVLLIASLFGENFSFPEYLDEKIIEINVPKLGKAKIYIESDDLIFLNSFWSSKSRLNDWKNFSLTTFTK